VCVRLPTSESGCGRPVPPLCGGCSCTCAADERARDRAAAVRRRRPRQLRLRHWLRRCCLDRCRSGECGGWRASDIVGPLGCPSPGAGARRRGMRWTQSAAGLAAIVCAAFRTADGACTGATDLVQAATIVEMCLNDERNGWAVPHTHVGRRQLQGEAVYQQPELGECIGRANTRIAGTAAHAALALSSGCLSCLVGNPTGTASVTNVQSCFTFADLTHSHICAGPEKAALASMFGAMDNVKDSCHCAVDGCGADAVAQAGCSLALGPVRAAMPSMGAPCGGCALQWVLSFSSPQVVLLACQAKDDDSSQQPTATPKPAASSPIKNSSAAATRLGAPLTLAVAAVLVVAAAW
jgi:hypothetical protein